MKQNCYCFGDELHVSQLEKHKDSMGFGQSFPASTMSRFCRTRRTKPPMAKSPRKPQEKAKMISCHGLNHCRSPEGLLNRSDLSEIPLNWRWVVGFFAALSPSHLDCIKRSRSIMHIDDVKTEHLQQILTNLACAGWGMVQVFLEPGTIRDLRCWAFSLFEDHNFSQIPFNHTKQKNIWTPSTFDLMMISSC